MEKELNAVELEAKKKYEAEQLALDKKWEATRYDSKDPHYRDCYSREIAENYLTLLEMGLMVTNTYGGSATVYVGSDRFEISLKKNKTDFCFKEQVFMTLYRTGVKDGRTELQCELKSLLNITE